MIRGQGISIVSPVSTITTKRLSPASPFTQTSPLAVVAPRRRGLDTQRSPAPVPLGVVPGGRESAAPGAAAVRGRRAAGQAGAVHVQVFGGARRTNAGAQKLLAAAFSQLGCRVSGRGYHQVAGARGCHL